MNVVRSSRRCFGQTSRAITWFSVEFLTDRARRYRIVFVLIDFLHQLGPPYIVSDNSFANFGAPFAVELPLNFRLDSGNRHHIRWAVGFCFSAQSITRFYTAFRLYTDAKIINRNIDDLIRSRFCFFQVRIIGKEYTCSPRYTHN